MTYKAALTESIIIQTAEAEGQTIKASQPTIKRLHQMAETLDRIEEHTEALNNTEDSDCQARAKKNIYCYGKIYECEFLILKNSFHLDNESEITEKIISSIIEKIRQHQSNIEH